MDFPTVQNTAFVSAQFESRPMQVQSAAGMARGLSLMRSGIYSDKKGAVVREYVCNAIDEHIKYCPNTPIEITIDEEGFRVRDFGKGLDKERIFNVFGAFFESTKEKDQIGGFGLGSKAGHAYTDIFHAVSYYEGVKTSYSFVLGAKDGLEAATSNLTHSEPSNEPSGIEICVPLETVSDRVSFESKARQFARFAQFPIKINGELVEKSAPIYQNGQLSVYEGSGVKVRMGNVMYDCPYRFKNLNNTSNLYVIDVPINAVTVPPSRETISQTKATEAYLVDAVNKIDADIEAYVNSLQFLPSPQDIFNIVVFNNLSQNFGDRWIERGLLQKTLRARFNHIKINASEYHYGSKALKKWAGGGRSLFDVGSGAHMPPNGIILIFKTTVGIGPAKRDVLREKFPDKQIYIIKCTDYELDKVPQEISCFFEDMREFKWPSKGQKVYVPKVRAPKEDVYASWEGREYGAKTQDEWAQLIKDDKIRFVIDKNDQIGLLTLARTFNGYVFTRSSKSLKFFKSLGLPTFQEWVKPQKDAIIADCVAKNNYDFIEERIDGCVLRSCKIDISKYKWSDKNIKLWGYFHSIFNWKLPELEPELKKVQEWLDSECLLAYAVNVSSGTLPKWIETKAVEKTQALLKQKP